MATNRVVEDIDPLKAEKEGKVREVGPMAVWSLSSCKPGFGVDQLRDNCLETYWQSDGPQPHLVNIQFRKKTTIQDVCLYADYKLDESYTPNKISVRAGTHFHDLQEVEVMELNEPSGWVRIPLKDVLDQPIRTYLVQIAVLSNHQNGRDTHLRQIRVHSPVENNCFAAIKFPMLTSIECLAYSNIR
ncbi:anaphase-promoting complex subunit 10-like [Stegodyphus dumicola]|uniref:anaphase-promoting complex subunit 10-like n=1 Tax=Stegodyphus dumicola TaxID=202533 RepID=UPI0015ACAE87|nr:anaphase-promoting complex subunit 10-like [Stegodyphus dumicola]